MMSHKSTYSFIYACYSLSWSTLMSCVVFTYAAGREYQRIAKLRGDPVLMWCNTTKSGGVKWSQNTTIGRRFSYVYINGSVEGSYSVRRRFSVSEHSLKIYNAQRTDSGRYDCFDSGEVRRYGYELNVTGKTID